MIRSMTGFGRAEQDTPGGLLVCEIRTVNHRYLELSIRLPEEFRGLEAGVRERLKALRRGKVDCSVRLEQQTAQALPALNGAVVAALLARAGELPSTVGGLRAIDVLRWPGALTATDQALPPALILGVVNQALVALEGARQREGETLAALLGERLVAIEGVVQAVRGWLPALTPAWAERLRARLAALPQTHSIEPARLEQEIVLFAQRADVAEEVDRISAHTAEVRRLLAHEPSEGRRLDFMMQELHREANTLGSKAADLRLTRASVDLKVLIEQMREQVQNIE